MTTGTGCSWTATSSVRWITVTVVSMINKNGQLRRKRERQRRAPHRDNGHRWRDVHGDAAGGSVPNPPSGLRVISKGN